MIKLLVTLFIINYFMFKAFISIDDPSSNLAEVVHAGWKNSHAINLSLLRCAHKDIKCSLYIKQWMKDLRLGEWIFLGINRKQPHFHHKMKINFIFLAELVVLILGTNVQLFFTNVQLIHFLQ